MDKRRFTCFWGDYVKVADWLKSLKFRHFRERKRALVRSQNPDGGGYEIRTREAVTPTRFPSVRHRPLGEFSNYATLSGVYPLSAT